MLLTGFSRLRRGATTGKVEARNTAIKNIRRTARGYRDPGNQNRCLLANCLAGAGMTLIPVVHFATD
ncbi:transposase [Pseudarthrobacter sp. NCCP-2145]|uniref:transposase n=1 Tax=Pseudarthrobacter sp. NCCP-2145 TaxID=2942290 RepID=UPI0037C8EF0B